MKGENRLSRAYLSFSVTPLEVELELIDRSQNLQAAIFSPGHEPALFSCHYIKMDKPRLMKRFQHITVTFLLMCI